MKCPVDNGVMHEAVFMQEDEFRGVTLRFSAPGLRCEKCDYQTVSVAQVAAYNRSLADAYRVQEGLLTSGEVREARERLDMSQQDFADYLGVGVASVKRWEWGQVQEKSLDKLMRVLTDPAEADRVARRVRNLVGRDRASDDQTSKGDSVGLTWAALLGSHGNIALNRTLQSAWSAMIKAGSHEGAETLRSTSDEPEIDARNEVADPETSSEGTARVLKFAS